jgi:release factor glutamine methyltransferase
MSPSPTVSKFIRLSTKHLLDAGISTARLDCIVLLEDELGKDRAWLLANQEFEIPKSSAKRLSANIAKRADHMPIAYIRGKTEFYGREFAVNAHTLVPRPETEAMIGLLKKLPISHGTRFLDVGTGSGCIAITAVLELPRLIVSACDTDTQCLAIAERNAHNLQAQVTFVQSDLLQEVAAPDIIGANLPYVPDDFQINTAATHEPRHFRGRGRTGSI